ncbi:hypothetical protein V6N13_049873 [Hibiscus sabdariffa]
MHDLRKIEEHVVHVELVDLEAVESSFYRQKAKIQSIQNGDLGIKLFQSTAIVKKKKNTIRVMHDANGNRLDSFETIAAEMFSFFENLIGQIDGNVKEYYCPTPSGFIGLLSPSYSLQNLVVNTECHCIRVNS